MNMLLIYNAHLVDKYIDKKGSLLLDGKKIKAILSQRETNEILKLLSGKSFPQTVKKNFLLSEEDLLALETYDAHGQTVMPSFVDMHAHFRDPGFTQKEDIESGCHAATAGGYGTVVLMPNTKPVISSLQQAEENVSKAATLNLVRIIQSASITKNFDGQDVSHIKTLDEKKIPLITEDGHEVANAAVMLEGMKSAAQKKIIVSCHCEDPLLAEQAKPFRKQALSLLNATNSHSTKKEAILLLTKANKLLDAAEDIATLRNIRLAEEAGCHLHLCHVSTAVCIEAVRIAKKRGDNITCEITPHHLGLSGNSSPTIFEIVNPPLRSDIDRRALIQALVDGTADTISTDHAPHTAADKAAGSPGFSGLETAFAVCNTVLVKGIHNCYGKTITLSKLSALMSRNAAEILGLEKTGLLAQDYEANLVIVDTNKKWKVRGAQFESKGKYSPFEGKSLVGKVTATFFNGKKVF